MYMKYLLIVPLLLLCSCSILPNKQEDYYIARIEKENQLLRKSNKDWEDFAIDVKNRTSNIKKETLALKQQNHKLKQYINMLSERIKNENN
jgi:hypothetical protein